MEIAQAIVQTTVMRKEKNGEKAEPYSTMLPPTLKAEFLDFTEDKGYVDWRVVAAGIVLFMSLSPRTREMLIGRDPSQVQHLADLLEGATEAEDLGEDVGHSDGGRDGKPSKRDTG